MHLFPSLRQLTGLALATAMAMPAMAQTAPPQQSQQPAAQEGAPQNSGQNPPAPRGGGNRAVPANKPAQAAQPVRAGGGRQQAPSATAPTTQNAQPVKPGGRQQSPYKRQPVAQPPAQPAPQPGQPAAQGQPPAQPEAQSEPAAAPTAQGQPPAPPNVQGQAPPPPNPGGQPPAQLNPLRMKLTPVQGLQNLPVTPPNQAASPPPPQANPAKAAQGKAALPPSPRKRQVRPTITTPVPPAGPPTVAPQQPPASPVPAGENPPAAPAATGPAQPPSPELGIKPFAPGGAMSAAVSAARSGELNPNTYFADWKDGAPVGWSVWNPADGCSVRQKEVESGKAPVVELVPSPAGFIDFCYRVPTKETGISGGDSILLEVEFRADAGAPAELMLRMRPESSGVDLRLPCAGEGVWRTLRISMTVPAVETDALEVALRLRGVKQGTVALVRRASIMLIPPV